MSPEMEDAEPEESATNKGSLNIEETLPLRGSVSVDADSGDTDEAAGRGRGEQEEGIVVPFPDGPKKYRNLDEVVEKYVRANAHLDEQKRMVELERQQRIALEQQLAQTRMNPVQQQNFEDAWATRERELAESYETAYALDSESARAAARNETLKERKLAELEQQNQAILRQIQQQQESQRVAMDVQRIQQSSGDKDFNPWDEDCQRIISENGQMSLNALHKIWSAEKKLSQLSGMRERQTYETAKTRMGATSGTGGERASSRNGSVNPADLPFLKHMPPETQARFIRELKGAK